MVVLELSGISRIPSRYRLHRRARHEPVSYRLMSRHHRGLVYGSDRGLGDRPHDHGHSL